MSKVIKVKNFDIANGEGISISVFFSGCEHHCKGCFNQAAWNFDIGEDYSERYYQTKIKPLINEHIDHLSILGGEPLHPENLCSVYRLMVSFKRDFPDKKIWLWSGYTYEELMSEEYEDSLDLIDYIDGISFSALRLIDVLVDGRFVEDQKDLTLKWRGSKNQRVIDLPKTLATGKVVLYKNN